MSKVRSMEEQRSVSSWCVPLSISNFAASAAVVASPEGEGFASRKPRDLGGWERRNCSIDLRADSARMFIVLMMSSRRDCGWWSACGGSWGVLRETYDGGVAEVLCQEFNVVPPRLVAVLALFAGLRHGDSCVLAVKSWLNFRIAESRLCGQRDRDSNPRFA